MRLLVGLLALLLTVSACSKGKHAESKPAGTEGKTQAKTNAKPHLPDLVPPGWKLTSFVPSAPPPSIPPGGTQDCWEGNYSGIGSALVWVCRYGDRTGEFVALENAKTQRQIMTFQQGDYLVVMEWTADSIADLTALVRAVKENLNPPSHQ